MTKVTKVIKNVCLFAQKSVNLTIKYPIFILKEIFHILGHIRVQVANKNLDKGSSQMVENKKKSIFLSQGTGNSKLITSRFSSLLFR